MSDSFDAYDIETGKGHYEFELTGRFDETLDDCYGDIDIAGMPFDASRAFKELDPIAYR